MISNVMEALDGYVARNGYGKALAAALTVVSVVSFVSALFGTTWLRAVVAFLMMLAVLLFVLLGIAERQRLHNRIELDADTINRYVQFIGQRSPFSIRSWKQTVTIAKNGDVSIKREMTLSRAADNEPHFLRANVSYYGTARLTESAKRRVNVEVYRLNPADGDRGPRVHRTYSWSTTPAGKPSMDVVVHLDGGIVEGEVVIVEWDWPRFSDDLRSSRSTELFDVVFRRPVADFHYEIRLKDCGRIAPVIARRGSLVITDGWDGKDYVVKFEATKPEVGVPVGVVLDMGPRR